jgi:hypothetical protein
VMKKFFHLTLLFILALAASGSEVRAQKNNNPVFVQPALVFGKPGTGEGEFRLTDGFWVDPRGRILVTDKVIIEIIFSPGKGNTWVISDPRGPEMANLLNLWDWRWIRRDSFT